MKLKKEIGELDTIPDYYGIGSEEVRDYGRKFQTFAYIIPLNILVLILDIITYPVISFFKYPRRLLNIKSKVKKMVD